MKGEGPPASVGTVGEPLAYQPGAPGKTYAPAFANYTRVRITLNRRESADANFTTA
jgi:hypothetical protein